MQACSCCDRCQHAAIGVSCCGCTCRCCSCSNGCLDCRVWRGRICCCCRNEWSAVVPGAAVQLLLHAWLPQLKRQINSSCRRYSLLSRQASVGLVAVPDSCKQASNLMVPVRYAGEPEQRATRCNMLITSISAIGSEPASSNGTGWMGWASPFPNSHKPQ
jgi:hypothetical protein